MSGTQRTHKHRRKWGPGGKKGFKEGDRRGGQESFIDLYNRLAAQYGPAFTDLMIGGPYTPFAVHAALSWISDDRDLWFEATGQRVSELRQAERLALECWLWEAHDRARQEHRWKPKKSPRHDAPWPGARKWSPRRWFGPCPSGKPLTISTSRTVGMREQLDAEYADEAAWDEGAWLGGVVQVDAKELPSIRNHPSPGGSWSVAKVGGFLKWAKKLPRWEPCSGPLDARIWEVEPKHPHRQLRCDVPTWRARYEPEVDFEPPDSVLLQKHEPPDKPELEVTVGAFRLARTRKHEGRPPEWVKNFYDLRGRLSRPWTPPPTESEKEWWKTKKGRRYRYWDQHVIDVAAGVRWQTQPQRRPANARYTFDLVWIEVRDDIPRSLGAGAYLIAVPSVPRVLLREILRSPFFARGFPQLWRPDKDAKLWAAEQPKKRPSAWALEHVEKPADALSAKCEERRRRREAAIDGLLSNFG